MQKYMLHDADGIQWFMFGRDQEKKTEVIDTNEYVIVVNDEAIMLDPGGMEIFPEVLTAVSEAINISSIKSYLCSHQDPDIMSSLPLWLALTPQAQIYLSWIWTGFVSHFGSEYVGNFCSIPDDGMEIQIGGRNFQLVPAHYCHSSGNFHFFDPTSKILFTGDVGAALVANDYPHIVENFDEHIKYIEGFHKRWMPSNEAKNLWVKIVRKLAPKMLCPQHGSVFTGKNVDLFLDWFEELEVGKTKKSA